MGSASKLLIIIGNILALNCAAIGLT